MINILKTIHWMWYVLMIGALVVSICHGIQFHKWWLLGEWGIGLCIMIYTSYKVPAKKQN